MNEAGGISDQLIAEQTSYLFQSSKSEERSMRFSISDTGTLTISPTRNNLVYQSFDLPNLDIDGLIEYLQEAKELVESRKLVDRLRGK